MRYLLIGLLALAGFAQAETLEELKTRLDAAPNVIAVGEEGRGTFMPGVFSEIYFAKVIWLMDEGETVKKDSKDVLILNMGVQGQELVLGWLGEIPAPIKPVVEAKYLSGRSTGGWSALTGAQQLAAISAKLNEYWVHAQGAPRDPILHLVIDPINANTIKASGEFDTSTGWEKRTYYVTLTDPNGSLVAGNANVKFRRLTETVQAP